MQATQEAPKVHETQTDRTEEIVGAVKAFHADFKCQRCGKCCTEGVGVALWAHEFKRIAKLRKDIYKHITFLNNWHALKMPCVFYNVRRKKCSIYKERPLACRLYPLGVKIDGTMRVSQNCTAIRSKEGINGTAREA